MQKRGVFFSGDALIAVLIILLVLVIAVPTKNQTRLETEAHQDLLNSLSVLKVGEVNDSYVNSLIASGEISDLNKSLLEQIGDFYVTDIDRARLLAASVLSDLNFSENVGIWIGDQSSSYTLIYSKNRSAIEQAEDVDVARQILSGIVLNGTNGSVTGFSARAYLSSDLINNYYYFGGYVGDGNISLQVPYAGNITAANLEITINENFGFYVNGNFIGNYAKSTNDFTPANYSLPIGFFSSGNNTVEFRGNNLHIAGGFLKITHRAEAQFSQPDKYRFPGIEGLINLYDGFYVPGDLKGLKIFLHLNGSGVQTFFNIGNVTIFNSTVSNEQTINIDNSTLASVLDYNKISRKTIPLRLGLDNVSYTGIVQDIDVFSVTDVSGSMTDCILYTQPLTCTYNCLFGAQKSCQISNVSQCTGNVCGGACFIPFGHNVLCNSTKMDQAKIANNVFIDSILNYSGNRLGLVAYQSSVVSGFFHNLSNNATSLKNKVQTWSANGATCICCGINRAVSELRNYSSSSKYKSMVVMSDGLATATCAQQGTGNASLDAIQAACTARNYNITVNAVGFGNDADEATLQAVASCGGGSYFYADAEELADVYQQVALDIISSYVEQTLVSTGNIRSKLYDDSYIEFDYDEANVQPGLMVSLESRFIDSYSGIFSVPSDAQVVETRVSSYSGPRWTNKVTINGNNFYNLSEYGGAYISLGDPYIVNVPNSLVQTGSNIVNLTTGVGAGNSSAGSAYNKIIYTIVKNASSFSEIKPFALGCEWEIQFEDDSIISSNIPISYAGLSNCFYNSTYNNPGNADGHVESGNDALQVAVLNLMRELDLDDDGKIDFLFSEEDLVVSLDELTGIPFVVSSEVQARRWY